MSTDRILKSKHQQTTDFYNVIADAMTDNKGEDVVLIDVSEIEETVTDAFMICHGNSTTQVKGIAERIIEKVFVNCGEKPISKEGEDKANWIVIDYFNVVVHVLMKETREFYQLEDLWADTEIYAYDTRLSKLIRQDGKK